MLVGVINIVVKNTYLIVSRYCFISCFSFYKIARLYLLQKLNIIFGYLLVNYTLHCTNQHIANYAQTECQFRYCGTAIPFLTVRSTAR